MKTTKSKSKSSGLFGSNKKPNNQNAIPNLKKEEKDELIVIRDVQNNKEYYLSIVDTFVLSKREYIVMYNFVPDDGNHKDPELVIMRTEFTQKGEQLFYSIKDSDELEMAFTCFMRRYYSSSVPDKKARHGVATAFDGKL